uniref:Uncharacterized protein n=1 Tax=Dictyoglomus turgidum TaxID=513050 RepID=A0A7C3WMW9_9BACT
MEESFSEKENFSKKEWRCPNCNRLLGFIINDVYLEIESSNRQKILVSKEVRTALCKCGAIITVSGEITRIDFIKGLDK